MNAQRAHDHPCIRFTSNRASLAIGYTYSLTKLSCFFFGGFLRKSECCHKAGERFMRAKKLFKHHSDDSLSNLGKIIIVIISIKEMHVDDFEEHKSKGKNTFEQITKRFKKQINK